MREQLGLNKSSPDEFKVVSRAPLSIPPEFNLRPPQPGQARPQEGTVQQQARTAIFRATDNQGRSLDEVIPDDGRSVGERSLLRSAGAEIREDAVPEFHARMNVDAYVARGESFRSELRRID